MDIDKMEAGREMDALVAELMGWTVNKELKTFTTWVAITSGDDWCGIRPLCGTTKGVWGNWSPSTDISAAWPVVEKLQSMEITIRFHPQHRGPWKVTLFGLDGNLTFITEFADTAPLAICRAALKAVADVVQ